MDCDGGDIGRRKREVKKEEWKMGDEITQVTQFPTITGRFFLLGTMIRVIK